MRFFTLFISLFISLGIVAGVRTTNFNYDCWIDSWTIEASSTDTFLDVRPYGCVSPEEFGTPVSGYAYLIVGEKGFYPDAGTFTMVSVGEYTDVTDISLYAMPFSESTEIVLKEVKVGETSFTPSDVQIEGVSSEMKFQGKGSGNIMLTFSMSSRGAAQFLLYSIAVTHYAPNEPRGLSYSKSSATAVIGEIFEAPILNGATQNVEYSSSNPYVAMVKKDGTVVPLASGEATITASAPEDNMYYAGEASYNLSVSYTSTTEGTSDTICVDEPGELRMTIADLESVKIRELVIKGKLNAADIKYLKEASGRLSSLESLDLSDVILVPGDEPYGTFFIKNPELYGSGTYYTCYISDSTYTEHVDSELNGMGGGSGYYNCYGKGLAGAFDNSSLKRVVLPKNMERIGMSAFRESKQLVEVVIPETVKGIGQYAFYSCQSLRSVVIPKGANELIENSFSGCTSLVNVGDLSYVRMLGESTFSGCSSLVGDAYDLKLKLVSLDSIPKAAFNECNELCDIVFSEALSYIGSGAFSYCDSIRNLLFPNTLRVIASSAFYGCTSLETFNCPEQLERVSSTSFYDTAWMLSLGGKENYEVIYLGNIALAYDNPNTPHDFSLTFREGTISIADHFRGLKGYYDHEYIVGLVFPTSLKRIGDNAFNVHGSYSYGGTKITSLVLPPGIEEIGDCAFAGSNKITSVTFPSSLRNIGESAFAYCKSISSLVLPSTIEKIGTYAFRNCESLAKVYYDVPDAKGLDIFTFGMNTGCTADKVTVGANVRVLPDYIFEKSQNLVKVEFEERDQPLTLGKYVFSHCPNLKKIELPLGTDTIGSGAFWRSNALEEIVLPEGVELIGDNAFAECLSLKTIEFPSTLKKIGHSAFEDLVLQKIIVHATTPPTLAKTIYTGSGRLYESFSDYSAAVYIPDGTFVDYNATDWCRFTLIDAMETGVEDIVECPECVNSGLKAVYDLNGRSVDETNDGIYIINGKKVYVK